METGFIALGVFCILYYILLIVYSKRFSVTFGWFWLVFGAFQIVISVLVADIPKWTEYVIQGVMIVLSLIMIAIQILILTSMLVIPAGKLDYIIVLGAQVRGKRVTESLKRRLDKALSYLQKNPDTVCIVSGGQGKGEEISEAQAMAEYLIACGIKSEQIKLEEKSTSTYENLANSFVFIEDIKKQKVGIVTNNFHIYRSVKLAKALGYKKVYAVPASCNPVFFLNYMAREFFAVILMMYRLWKRRA